MNQNNIPHTIVVLFTLFLVSMPHYTHTYRDYALQPVNQPLYSPNGKYHITTRPYGPTHKSGIPTLYEIILTDTQTQQTYSLYIKCFCLDKIFTFSPDSKYLFIQPSFYDHILINLETKKIVFEGDHLSACTFSNNSKFFCLEYLEDVTPEGPRGMKRFVIELFEAQTSEKIGRWSGQRGRFSKYQKIFSFGQNNQTILHNLTAYKHMKTFQKQLLSPKNKKFADMVIRHQNN